MERQIPDNNLAYPCLLDLGSSTGSGFFLNTDNETFLVTAAHVLFDRNASSPLSTKLCVTAYTADLVHELKLDIDLPTSLSLKQFRVHPTTDVVVIKIAKIESGETRLSNAVTLHRKDDAHVIIGMSASGTWLFDDVLIANDVFVFGYPNSIGAPGLPQHDHSRPLVRKGIVAGKHAGNRTVIIDCPVYQGNSGGLVLEKRPSRVGAIGLVSSFIPFVELARSLHYGTVNSSIENSGYAVVIPMDFVYEAINQN